MVIKRNQFPAAVFFHKFTHYTFRKEPVTYITSIIPCIPAKFCKQSCIQCQLVKRFEKQINGLNIGIKSYLEVNLETNGVYHAI